VAATAASMGRPSRIQRKRVLDACMYMWYVFRLIFVLKGRCLRKNAKEKDDAYAASTREMKRDEFMSTI